MQPPSADACEYRQPRKLHMPDYDSDYQVGPGRPSLHTRFKKGQSGNPGGRSAKSLPALLAAALDETVYVTTNGRRRKITKARGDRHADGRQIGERRFARDQDADRHDEGRRAQGWRCRTTAGTAPAHRGGQGGSATLRGATTPADPAGNRG